MNESDISDSYREPECDCDDPKPLELGDMRPEHLDFNYRCMTCGGVADRHVDTENDE